MKIGTTLLTLLFSLCLATAPVAIGAQEGLTFLHCGTILDGAGATMREMTIVVDNDKILRIEKGYLGADAGAEVVDLKQSTVLPGLIDLHVHVEGQSSPGSYLERYTMDPADVALRATLYCRRTLEAGFTTVRDLGGTGVNVSLRNAINNGTITGPRIYTAEKSIASTGGHADPSNGRSRELEFDAGPNAGVINNADEAWKAVRTRYKNGADCIKITATGGVLSVAKDGQGPQFRTEEIAAIVAAAKDYGMHTAAHAHGKEGMERAIRGGITTIEHGTYMDAETMDLMIEHGTIYVPTLLAGAFVAEKAEIPGYFPAVIVPKARAIGPALISTFGEAYRHGVKIAFGTDSGVSAHGENAKEFALMVQAGMKPMEAIMAATSVAAGVLGRGEDLGQIKTGYVADLVAVAGNPLENVRLLESVNFVMKEGVRVK
ncbi:metal-dependent hydrolase family protein [Neolewinella antarctica]|uniref:Imidazolonepropionase-like amidohydrolase n=1 Tax=Neolewinella antarctica TaxID=442734 RepID=A0ABX0X8S2_9BACT|nr:amidohydrolase family protein [Neolewinella antarctica]NJC25567.1 imidazolonepropionase-like amidohydrolase [Neolewinella antarctica]